ncbi:MAG: hypothetical protein PVF17_00210 [Ignavibacteria bacterium]|jgi:hypothetical protein
MFKEFCKSISNLWKFRKVIWRWRWYDYSYQLDIIVSQLKLLDKKWGKDTHYLGDAFTAKRIKVILKYYEEYENTYDIVEEHKALQKFLKAYARLLPRLWD